MILPAVKTVTPHKSQAAFLSSNFSKYSYVWLPDGVDEAVDERGGKVTWPIPAGAAIVDSIKNSGESQVNIGEESLESISKSMCRSTSFIIWSIHHLAT